MRFNEYIHIFKIISCFDLFNTPHFIESKIYFQNLVF